MIKLDKIPVIIAKFLALPDEEGFDIYDKFAYLIKSIDGDNYYLEVQLPEDKLITEEFGMEIYEEIIKDISYKDIFIWYENWIV